MKDLKQYHLIYRGALLKTDSKPVAVHANGLGWRQISRREYQRKSKEYKSNRLALGE